MGLGMMPHTLNRLFLLFLSANNSLLLHHIFVPLVEEGSVPIMSDESNGIGSGSKVGYLRFTSFRKTHY